MKNAISTRYLLGAAVLSGAVLLGGCASNPVDSDPGYANAQNTSSTATGSRLENEGNSGSSTQIYEMDKTVPNQQYVPMILSPYESRPR